MKKVSSFFDNKFKFFEENKYWRGNCEKKNKSNY